MFTRPSVTNLGSELCSGQLPAIRLDGLINQLLVGTVQWAAAKFRYLTRSSAFQPCELSNNVQCKKTTGIVPNREGSVQFVQREVPYREGLLSQLGAEDEHRVVTAGEVLSDGNARKQWCSWLTNTCRRSLRLSQCGPSELQAKECLSLRCAYPKAISQR